MQFRGLPCVQHHRSQDHRYEQDEQPSCLAFLRPVPLAVGNHLAFHLLERLLLLVSKLVGVVRFHRIHVQLVGHDREESAGASGFLHFLLIKLEGLEYSVAGIVLQFEIPEMPLQRLVVIKGLSFLNKQLEFLPLPCDVDVQLHQFLAAAHRIEIEAQPQFLRPFDTGSDALYRVVNLELLVIQLRLQVYGHVVRPDGEVAVLEDPSHDKALLHLRAHDHCLVLQDVGLQVPDLLITPVGDQDDIFEACMVQIGEDGLEASGILHVAGEGPVVDRHVGVQGVDHHLRGLLKRQAFLVLSPSDVGQRLAVGAACGRVDRAQLSLAQPARAQFQQLHPVGFGDGLRQKRDHRRGELLLGRALCNFLPSGDTVVGETRHIREHGQGEDIIDHILVAFEHRLKILPQSRLDRNLVM